MYESTSQPKPILDRFCLEGRVALVTGAGRGIGRAFAHALGEAGAAVIIADIDIDSGQEVAKELKIKNIEAQAMEIDVTQSVQVNQMIKDILKTWDKLDIAVNNAGIGPWSAAESMTDDLWNKVLNVNLNGVFLCCRAEGQAMIKRGYGKIINTASMSARVVNWPQKHAHYNASKAAVTQLSRNLAVEWAEHGIRVNCISPGYTRTKLLEDLMNTPEGSQMVPQWIERTPMKRLAEVSDLQGAVIYLASEASDFMTGHDMVIDGGYSIW